LQQREGEAMSWKARLCVHIREVFIILNSKPSCDGARKYFQQNFHHLNYLNPALSINMREIKDESMPPTLLATYDWGESKSFDVSNLSVEEVESYLKKLLETGKRMPRSGESLHSAPDIWWSPKYYPERSTVDNPDDNPLLPAMLEEFNKKYQEVKRTTGFDRIEDMRIRPDGYDLDEAIYNKMCEEGIFDNFNEAGEFDSVARRNKARDIIEKVTNEYNQKNRSK